MEVNEELTRKVAELARLHLSDEEVKTFAPQVEKILTYVEQLGEVDVKGPDGREIEPLSNPLESAPGVTPPLRDDGVIPSPKDENGKPKTLKPAPETLSDGFKVPPIL